jgi:hypothetical protein
VTGRIRLANPATVGEGDGSGAGADGGGGSVEEEWEEEGTAGGDPDGWSAHAETVRANAVTTDNL